MLKKSRLATFAIGLLAVLVLLALIVGGLGMLTSGHKRSFSASTLNSSFKDVAELSVEEYRFQGVGKGGDNGYFLMNQRVPLTGNSFILKYKGTVSAGLKNFDDVKFNVNDSKQVVTITVPEVEVLSSHIDPTSVVPWDQSNNVFNPVKAGDVAELLAKGEQEAQQDAIDSGLLERAQARVEDLLRAQAEAATAGTGYSVEIKQD